jgi:hypothetical protein
VTELTFSTGAMPAIPLEIYDAELALIDRSLSSESVTVAPGTYFVRVHLPNGIPVRQSVDVTTEPTVVVELVRDTTVTLRTVGLPSAREPADPEVYAYLKSQLDSLLGGGEPDRAEEERRRAGAIELIRVPERVVWDMG